MSHYKCISAYLRFRFEIFQFSTICFVRIDVCGRFREFIRLIHTKVKGHMNSRIWELSSRIYKTLERNRKTYHRFCASRNWMGFSQKSAPVSTDARHFQPTAVQFPLLSASSGLLFMSWNWTFQVIGCAT